MDTTLSVRFIGSLKATGFIYCCCCYCYYFSRRNVTINDLAVDLIINLVSFFRLMFSLPPHPTTHHPPKLKETNIGNKKKKSKNPNFYKRGRRFKLPTTENKSMVYHVLMYHTKLMQKLVPSRKHAKSVICGK